MTPRPAVRELAGAVRRAQRREAERRGPGRYEGVVLDADPLRVDVIGLDEDLDEDDITIGDALAMFLLTRPLEPDDVLVLVELGDGDFVAVDIRSDREVPRDDVAERLAVVTAQVEGLAAQVALLNAAGASVAVLREAEPSVEYPEFAALAVGDVWTAAFAAARDHVGPGGAFRAENRLYEVGDLALLPQQRFEGQGPARTVLRAPEGAVRVLDMPGVLRHSKLKGMRIDGRGRASAGTRLQALNGTGGNTSQDAAYEDVEWWACNVGQLVAGTGPVPQDGQADKTRYIGCAMFQCSVGLRVDAINGQEQLWLGGEISDPIGGAMIGVLLNGGGFSAKAMQFQSTILGTGTMIVFGGANVQQVLLEDIISEGWHTGIDSGDDNLWPLQGVTAIGSTLQVHEPAGGDLVIVDRGGSIAGLVGIHCAINGGAVRLRGNDTYFEDLHCSYNLAGGVGGRVIQEGINSRHLPRRGGYIQVVAASTIDAKPGATTIAVFPGPQIDTITGGWDSREITLSFVGAVTVGSGTGNIALEGGAAFPGTAADTLTLVSEGGVWRQKGRSVN